MIIPALLSNWKMAVVVSVEIAAFPFSSCERSPSPAVMRSFDFNKTSSGSSATWYTTFVLPSIITGPNFTSVSIYIQQTSNVSLEIMSL